MRKSNFSRIPFDPSKWPFFYGWFVIILGTLGMLMSIPGQTMGVSAFTNDLIDALNISRDQLSLAYMIGTILSALLLTKVGKLYDKYGARVIASCGAVGLGLSLIYLSQVNSIISWLSIENQIISIIILMTSGFSMIRFFGQGVLTLASRTMMMTWFDTKRGFATSFCNVFVSLGFSGAPFYLGLLIENHGWSDAWFILGLTAAVIFPIITLVFFRNSPQEVGLQPDGIKKSDDQTEDVKARKEFSLAEAKKTYAFWIVALFLGTHALFITGFTFHVDSIFEMANLNEETAKGIFPPIAIVSVVCSLLFGWLSDRIQIQSLLYAKGIAAVTALIGFVSLGHFAGASLLLTLGIGTATGLYGVISAVAWPRFFGKQHLGAINGFNMTIIVLGSSFGPMLFSLSLSQTGSYVSTGGLVLLVFTTLTLLIQRIVIPDTRG